MKDENNEEEEKKEEEENKENKKKENEENIYEGVLNIEFYHQINLKEDKEEQLENI